jgi:FAD/FMN-containing dehydrogenase
VTPGAEVEPRYLGDWMLKAEGVRPAALVRPRTAAEVSAALRMCHERRIPVVVQGGRTGLAGGATPGAGWTILSLERMHAVGAPDRASSTIMVEAGATLQSVQEAADRAGLLFPLDIGSRGACTIGGNIATNAGGNRVLRYGMMRELVLGLETVLADGTILSSMNTMLKNNAGFDIKQAFIGSEGSLGVVTRAVLRLHPKPAGVQTAFCAVKNYPAALDLLDLARGGLGPTLSAFEVMWPRFYALATDAREAGSAARRPPLPGGHGAYVLVEAMGVDETRDAEQFQGLIEAAFDAGVVQDAVIAQSLKDSLDFWAVRDSAGELVRTFWPHVIFDVSVRVGDIGRFVDECTRRLQSRWAGAQTVWFGHAADSNLHIAVRIPDALPHPDHEVEQIVYDCVGAFEGSISAEHGIGLLKREFLGRSRSPAEIEAMRRLKRALDPQAILNPGKVFD